MVEIKTKKGLDIPIVGKPEGSIKSLTSLDTEALSGQLLKVSLDLNPFDEVKFKVLVRVDDRVKLGQVVVEDKSSPGRFFVAPAGGVVREIRRGLKRKLLDIVIEVDRQEEILQHFLIDLATVNRQELVDYLLKAGIFASIRQRPFNFLANPTQIPRTIFVKALESAPFVPPAEMQVTGYEKEFQLGLDALNKLTTGQVHLVYRTGTDCRAFTEAKNVEKHTAEGPHPISNQSLHIQKLDPITSWETVIWTVDVHTVVKLGYLLLHGCYFTEKVIGIGGPGVVEGQTGYFKVREGCSIHRLVADRVKKGYMRLISGDPLSGSKVETEDYLGFYDYAFCIIPENTKREFLHFFRLGLNKYTFSRAYLSGHLDNSQNEYSFTTNRHGEERAFIDNTLYDKVMPLNVSTMHLVKAIMAEDYDLAASLGLLEVDSEDFLLPTFVCPSKIEMRGIVKKGLKRYAEDTLN